MTSVFVLSQKCINYYCLLIGLYPEEVRQRDVTPKNHALGIQWNATASFPNQRKHTRVGSLGTRRSHWDNTSTMMLLVSSRWPPLHHSKVVRMLQRLH